MLPGVLKPGNRYPVVYFCRSKPRRRESLRRWSSRDSEAWPARQVPDDFRRPDLFALALVCRPSDAPGYPPGVVFSQRRHPVRRGPLSSACRTGESAPAGFQQIGLGSLEFALEASRRLRQGRRLGRPARDGSSRTLRVGRNLRDAGEFRELSRGEPASTPSGRIARSERLILLGYGNFRGDHQKVHDLMADLRISHVYADGPKREHRWESGWLSEAVQWLRDD